MHIMQQTRDMERWGGKVAIVTGASCGIGASIAEKLVKAGLKVVGFARRPELIERNAAKLSNERGKLYALKVDLTVEAEIVEGFRWTTEHVGLVHILINNAGSNATCDLIDGDTAAWRQILETNFLAVAIAAKEAYNIMSNNRIAGHIVNINSILGHMTVSRPGTNMYTTSKNAVTCYNDLLMQELSGIGSKIKVTSISPGVVRTEMYERAPEEIKAAIAALLEPEDVADGILYALGTPPHVQIKELTIKPVGELI